MSEVADPGEVPGIPVPRAMGSGAVEQAVAIWHVLAELGVGEAVIAPGSRSAPLVHALAEPQLEARIRAHVRIDERAAAFTALGISRHDPQRPGVVVTTSGTATAHLHAAVMEAHHSRVPLLVITADRPAELRGTGANQTTRQAGLFRDLVRFDADLPAPGATRAARHELRTAVNTVARALAAATGEHPGPVHLNLGFRDPLVPASGADLPETAAGEGAGPELVVTRRAPRPRPAPHPVPVSERTVVVAGDSAGPQAARFADRHCLPLLAEPSSGARAGELLVPGYPALLARVMADPGHPLRPDRAVVFGRPTLSRAVVGALLGAEDVEVVVVDAASDWTDAARRARLVVPAAIGDDPERESRLGERRERWRSWCRAAADPGVEQPSSWQQRAAVAVWEASGKEDVLVLGSSSLVRDLDQHAGSTAARVVANRGLAGIDGTTSMAGGLALARGAAPGRVRLLVGDLTALHDLTGLIIGPEEQVPDLDVVVVDDGGGRIFSGLEHTAAPPDLLRRFFTTPHGADLAAAAAALGARSATAVAQQLPGLLAEHEPGLRVIVVQETSSSLPSNASAGMVG